jgi:hypothetical protein
MFHGREMFRYRREGDREDADVQAGEIMDRQAAHVPDVAGRIYAREVGEQPGVIASRRGQYRLSSVAWHREVLGFVAPRDESMEVDQGQGPGVGKGAWDDLYDATDDEADEPDNKAEEDESDESDEPDDKADEPDDGTSDDEFLSCGLLVSRCASPKHFL